MLCLTCSNCVLQVAPTHLRGTLGSVNQLVICFGILGALVCNIALPATQWRTIFGLTVIPAVLLFLGTSCSRKCFGVTTLCLHTVDNYNIT